MFFEFLPQLVLRTPLLSYQEYDADNLNNLLQQDWFKLTIYLASADFYERLAEDDFSAVLLTHKERVTLLKYYNRMSFRPTPFGAFSSFSSLPWGEGLTSVRLGGVADAKLKLLIDQAAATMLSKAIFNDNVTGCLFFSNPTLYKTNKEFRYIKTLRDDGSGRISYLLESFEANRFTKNLLHFLKQTPESYLNIITYIKQNAACDDTEAAEYLSFLIEAQIVVSKYNITVLGEDYLSRLINLPFLPPVPRRNLAALIKQTNAVKFGDLDGIVSLTGKFGGLFNKSGIKLPRQLFYANTGRPVSGLVNIQHQQQLKDALHCLRLLSQPGQPKMLADFIKQFKERFDLQKVPLLQALDPETGIAYGTSGAMLSVSPLMQDMYFDHNHAMAENIQWSVVHRLLFNKWNSSANPRNEIVIEEEDLAAIEEPLLPIPPSISVIFRLYDDTIVIESAGGASATALIGRFTLLSSDIKSIADKVARHEQDSNPDVIFAEINQLTDDHVDNINRRLPVYDHEIAINVPCSLNQDKQIDPSDLLLSVVNDELVMESVKLKKRVIPRLSTAYNYHNHQLNLFRFLGDLQHHGVHSNLMLDLETMFPGMPFYPRVTYRQTILCLAKWYLFEKDIKCITQANGNEAIQKVQQLRADKHWPTHIALGQTDQQLIFNLDDEREILLFADCIKTESRVKLTEHLMPYATRVTDDGGKQMVNQFIAMVLSADKTYRPLPNRAVITAAKQTREFIAGSKWIYFKIYCTPGRANHLLTKKILPVLRSLKQGEVQCWFFVRYADTAPHIRLRINVKEEFLGNILVLLKIKLAADVRYQLIKEYKADVYRRELERYGADIIEDVEKVFEASSELVINYLKLTTAPTFNFTYHSLAIVSVAAIVSMFFEDINGQINFTQQIAHSFSLEHKDVKTVKVLLDKKYRSLKDEIAQLLANKETYYKRLKLTHADFKLREHVGTIINLARDFTAERKARLAADIIHMHLNRLFPDEQRYQELIIYHCLYKHLQAVAVRAAKQV